MGTENVLVKNKSYEMVPPDGGWGYMICIAAIINYLALAMFAGSFGIIFKDFLVQIDMGSTSVMLLSGVNMMCLALAGYFTSPLLRFMSMRKLALVAALLFNIGVFCTIFINTKMLLFLCQGMQCAGGGLMYNITCTQINDYFLKKRLLAISLVQTFTAVGGMAAPLLVKWSLESFGFRGTLIMISAIALQTLISVALMQPVSKHLVKKEIDSTTEEMKLLIKEPVSDENKMTTPMITLTDTEPKYEAKIDVNNDLPGDKSNDSKILTAFLDVQLLKKFLLSNVSMGPTFCLFADIIFSLMLPLALYDMGWSKENVAKAIALASLGDLITRAAFVFLSKWLARIGSQEVYLITVALAFLSRLCMLWSENTIAIMIFITLIGITRCSINVLPPLILAETFGPDQFTKALGIYMMVLGLMNLILGPAIGAVRDLTNSYSTAFYIITSCFAVVLLLWSIELLYKKNKHKRIIQREAAEKLMKLNVKNVKNKGK